MDSTATPGPPHAVVGIARDIRQSVTDDDRADLYVPFLQNPGRFPRLYLRGTGISAFWQQKLRSAVRDMDPEVAVGSVEPLSAIVNRQRSRPRFLASLLTGFSLFAAILALFGVFGVVAYAVRKRQHEVAVRIAVGADSGDVMALFLREGAIIVGSGLGAGILGGAAIGRLLESQLVGVSKGEPWTLGAAALGFGAAGMAAVWGAGRRALATDPIAALREQ